MFKKLFKKGNKSSEKEMFKHLIFDESMNIVAGTNDMTAAVKLCQFISKTDNDTFFISTETGFREFSIAGERAARDFRKNQEIKEAIRKMGPRI